MWVYFFEIKKWWVNLGNEKQKCLNNNNNYEKTPTHVSFHLIYFRPPLSLSLSFSLSIFLLFSSNLLFSCYNWHSLAGNKLKRIKSINKLVTCLCLCVCVLINNHFYFILFSSVTIHNDSIIIIVILYCIWTIPLNNEHIESIVWEWKCACSLHLLPHIHLVVIYHNTHSHHGLVVVGLSLSLSQIYLVLLLLVLLLLNAFFTPILEMCVYIYKIVLLFTDVMLCWWCC